MLSNPSIATIVVSCVFPTLAFLAVALRFQARRVKSLALEVDDYLILLALTVTIASCVPYIIGATIGGIGVHIQELTPDEFIRFGKILFALQFTYLGAVSLVKLSILFFYKRIFCTRKFKTAVNVLSVITVLWFITFFFATLFQALPISVNWTAGPGTMINEYAMYTATAVIEMLLDIATLVMPWPMIWTLQIDNHRKWVVSGIFLLGGFVCISSIVRLYYLVDYLNPSASQTIDFTYDLANIIIWSAIEPCAGVICACLPTLGPIFRHRSPKSLVGSLNRYLTFRALRSKSSKSTFGSEKEKSPKPSVTTAYGSGPFLYPMPDRQGGVVTYVEGSEGVGDLEKGRVPPKQGIMVDTDLSSVSRGEGCGR